MRARTALLVGGTGLVGGFCLEHLLADDAYERVVALTRRPLGVTHTKLDEHIMDFANLAELSAQMAVDEVFCCLGTTLENAGSKADFEKVDLELVKHLGELASKAGASQFLLVSSVGASHFSPLLYGRVKKRAEEAISELTFRSVHLFRPGLLLGHRSEPRPNEDFLRLLSPYMSLTLWGPLRRYRPVHAEVVAEQMVAQAKRDAEGVHIHPVSAYF